MSGPNAQDELDALLRERAVVPVFQPIVDLATGRAVAAEALTRGPVGCLAQPDQLFATARASGRLAELDLLCRVRALEEAAAAGITGPVGLFLNVEPDAVPERTTPVPAGADLLGRGVRVVLEFTERALTADPAALLAFAARARSFGYGIALDDVGAEPASLALMPFLRPEIVKLDLGLVQARPGPRVAEIMSAVAAYAEQSGATVLAEGIETPAHLAAARSLGATLGQGWYFAWAGPAADVLPALWPSPGVLGVRHVDPVDVPASPFEVVADVRSPRRATKPLLVEVSRLLERQATEQGALAVVVAAYEVGGNFTPSARRRYAALARSAAFVAVLGTGLGPVPEPGVRGAHIPLSDPLSDEWDVAVVGPHFAAALVARDLAPGTHDPHREFDYVLTHDRSLVLDVARSLIARALPSTTPCVPGRRFPVDPAPVALET